MATFIETLPFGPQPTGQALTGSPLGEDEPCPFATLTVLANSARLNISTKAKKLWITMPYDGYTIKYTVSKDLYYCIGWYRRQEDFTITISDGAWTCEFVIPGLGPA